MWESCFFSWWRRIDLTGHTFCLLPLPFSPAWNMDIMSRAEQPSCDYEDGGVGTGSQVASLNNCRPLDSLCHERWEKWVRSHSWVLWHAAKCIPCPGENKRAMRAPRACLSVWKLTACFTLCLEPLLVLCSLGLVLTPALVAFCFFLS